MALKKSVTLPNGVKVEYWRVIPVVDLKNLRIIASVECFVSAAARLAGDAVVNLQHIIFKQNEQPPRYIKLTSTIISKIFSCFIFIDFFL